MEKQKKQVKKQKKEKVQRIERVLDAGIDLIDAINEREYIQYYSAIARLNS